MRIILEIIIDTLQNIAYFIKSNLRNLAMILNISLPYAMYIIGQYVCDQRGKKDIGFEILIPLCVSIIIYFIRSYANKIRKGTTLPLPDKRFTEVDDDGEVTVENSRIQELLLYIADLEDWLERKGLM